MEVYWFEQSVGDVPADDSWLSDDEARQLAMMRIPKRRADWRLGRWTAKRAIACQLRASDRPVAFSDIQIRAAASGAPEAFLVNEPAALAISLSHCSGRAACALADRGVVIGCDLESIEPRSNAFVSDYFTASEQEMIACASEPDRPLILALLWSAKESALKALQCGLRRDTRSVQVKLSCSLHDVSITWLPFTVASREGRTFEGYWRRSVDQVATLVADPAPFLPIDVDLEPL